MEMNREGAIRWKGADSNDTLLDGYNCSEKNSTLNLSWRKWPLQNLSVLFKITCCLKLYGILSLWNCTGKDLSPFW